MTGSTEARAGEALAPAGARRTRVPDFYLVGHPKSGTTALYEMLRAHPRIFMPDSKEPWFFASDARPRFQPEMAGVGPQTLEQYLALFEAAAAGQLVGEASSSYLWSTAAAAAIAAARPDARIVAILREPASFLRSWHLQLVQDHVEYEKDLRTALELEPARRRGEQVPPRSHRPQLLLYSDFVGYVEQLRRYRDAFGSGQVLVLIYDDFLADNEGTVRRVLRFLGVEDARPFEAVHANPTVRMRSLVLDRAVHAVTTGRGPLGRAVKGAVKALTPRTLRRDALSLVLRRVVRAAPPAPDERLMAELRSRFRGEVAALGEYLDRDLITLWGYDGID